MTDQDEPLELLRAQGSTAFGSDSTAQRNSRVSQIVALGTMLRGIEDEDVDELVRVTGVPRIDRQSERDDRPLPEIAADVFERMGRQRPAFEIRPEAALERSLFAWIAVAELRTADAGYALLYQSLGDPDPTVRAMAASVLAITHPIQDRVVEAALQAALAEPSGYAPVFARIALAKNFDVRVPTSARFASGPKDPLVQPLSMVVHGTFARLAIPDRKWYLPEAKLPSHIRGTCTPDLYLGTNYFRWSGEYTPTGRICATDDLLKWCDIRRRRQLDTVFAHSHGGNVILDAIQRGLSVELLVLLHTPVLERTDDEWEAIQQRVGRILDLRNSMDWVVGLDKVRNYSHNRLPAQLSNSRRLTPSVPEHLRFSHNRFIKKKTWSKLRLHEEVAYERSLI